MFVPCRAAFEARPSGPSSSLLLLLLLPLLLLLLLPLLLLLQPLLLLPPLLLLLLDRLRSFPMSCLGLAGRSPRLPLTWFTYPSPPLVAAGLDCPRRLPPKLVLPRCSLLWGRVRCGLCERG